MTRLSWRRNLVVWLAVLLWALLALGSSCESCDDDSDDDDEGSSEDGCNLDGMCTNFFLECGWTEFDITTPGSCEAGLADRCFQDENTDAYLACLCECRERHPDTVERMCGCEDHCRWDHCIDELDDDLDDDMDDDMDDDADDDECTLSNVCTYLVEQCESLDFPTVEECNSYFLADCLDEEMYLSCVCDCKESDEECVDSVGVDICTYDCYSESCY